MPDPAFPLADDARSRPLDVLCLGHALVDRLAHARPADVAAAGMEPGVMTLVEGTRATEIERALPGWAQAAGGSAANTAAGIASLGGRPGFVGSVGADDAGAWYAGDLERHGVRCTVDVVADGAPTGLCHVLVTPGGERSMATSLGAAGKLHPGTVSRAGVGDAAVVYLEGYLLDAPEAAEALEAAADLARGASTLVALSMSDPFVVARHRARILEMLCAGTLGVLFGNEEEALGLSGADSLAQALDFFDAAGQVAVVTRGAKGAVVTSAAGRTETPAWPEVRVEDTTGAGDLFAAGCLFALTDGADWATALRVGAFAAAEVISHMGARPAVVLRDALPPELSSTRRPA